MTSLPPVAIFCYNRPDLTRRVLESVRVARPGEVLVIADGPRQVAGDAERCAAVRQVVEETVDWPCTVRRRFAEANLGLERNVELGLDWVFGTVEEAVILEDDCIPDPTFFRFCAELLERYRDHPEVMMISGTRIGAGREAFHGADYAFTTFSITWGWATWARAWHAHRRLFPRDWVTAGRGAEPGAPWRSTPAVPAPGSLATRAAARYIAEVGRARGQEFGWDSHWFHSQIALGGHAVAPAGNHVQNAGFGDEATHTVSTRRMPRAEPVRFPLVHPPEVRRDHEVQRRLELVLVRVNGRLARTVKRLVPQGRLRVVGRAMADRLLHSRRHR